MEAPPTVESGESEVIRSGREPQSDPQGFPPLPGWRCVPQAVVRAYGEEGVIDLVALQPERGAALVALLQPGEEASPEEARAAFLTMLVEEGFSGRFGGELPVVALTVAHAAPDDVAAAIERAFAAMPRPRLAETWVDWLAERLAPARPSAPTLLAPHRDEADPPKPENGVALLAPSRDEPPPLSEEHSLRAPARAESVPERNGESTTLPPTCGTEIAATPASEALPAVTAGEPAQSVVAEPQPSWLDWGASLGFAVGILLVMLIGLAVFSHNGRLF